MESYYRTVLANELASRQKRNARFSLRSFARQLDISPGQLSGLMSGRKNLTARQAVKLIEKLELSEEESIDLLRGLHPGLLSAGTSERSHRLFLSDDEFRLISEWQHFAILSLGDLKENRADIGWVSERLGIDRLKAQAAFSRLERLGFLKVKNGRFRQTSKPLGTETDVPSRAIRDYHRQNLELAATKLEEVAVQQREFTSVTLAIEKTALKKAKKLIADFREKLARELESPKAEEVYTLAIQFFPVTNLNKSSSEVSRDE